MLEVGPDADVHAHQGVVVKRMGEIDARRAYRRTPAQADTDALVADSQNLPAHAFGQRYGLQPGYMAGSNAYFERTAQVAAAWNRLIVYDGSLFHSADVDPARLSADPVQGRLTLKGKTHPVVLKALKFNCYINPLFRREVCGGDFEANIMRSQWDIIWGLQFGFEDAVRLLIQVEAIKIQ